MSKIGTSKMRSFLVLPVIAAVALGAVALSYSPAKASSEGPEMEKIEWSFNGPFGTYDRNQLRRGYKVYKEVCATCHSMHFVHFRNLAEKGGPEFTEGQVKTLAAEVTVQDGPDASGEMFERPGEARDVFPSPYANEEAAAAVLGAPPPDLSVIAKAREGGPDYIHALLTSYTDAPADVTLPAGGHYNPVFTAGSGIIAMPAPLSDGQVEYEDGTPNTVDQMSRDVSAFLMWTAEPKLEQRKTLGFQVMLYLVALAGLLYFVKRKVWADVH